MYCPNCGRNLKDTAKFCVGCGIPQKGPGQQKLTELSTPENPAEDDKEEAKKAKKITKKSIVLIFFAILVISGLTVAAIICFCSGDSNMGTRNHDKAETVLEDVTEKKEGREQNEPNEPITDEKSEEGNEPTASPDEPKPIDVAEALKNAAVGEYITFGTYEQDNNWDNGAEPVEWLVLEKRDGKALVLSEYILDCQKYNEELLPITWEDCTLRSWLNNEFYNTAFSQVECSFIAEKTVINGEREFRDKVFLLSTDEVLTYFDPDMDKYDPVRSAKITEYAKKQGGKYPESGIYHENGYWWLRSLDGEGKTALNVGCNGGVSISVVVTYEGMGVRPALWISYSEQEAPAEELTPTITPLPDQSPFSRKMEKIKRAAVGDYIYFGTYEQDNNLDNGGESIRWLVLEKRDGKALVLSDQTIECIKYNEENVAVTWENCTLRSWLNNEFYNTAFDIDERSVVAETLVKNSDTSYDGATGGNDTEDKVFLLSIEEVTTYFASDPYEEDFDRSTRITEYALRKGATYATSSWNYRKGYWWLRTSGDSKNVAPVVDYDGAVCGSEVDCTGIVLRPALWIDYSEQEPTESFTPTPIPTDDVFFDNVEVLKNAAIGDTVFFGTYEQDSIFHNGEEPIEWMVLDKEDGKALVLSKYALDAMPYNKKHDYVTWETCTLRSWLNDEFYCAAFSEKERSLVVETLVKNEDNPDCGTKGGNETQDKVFLLSLEEVTSYFDTNPDLFDEGRRAKVTEYAITQGGRYSENGEYYGNGWWWLRSPGLYGDDAMGVNYSGYVSRIGADGEDNNNVVRPALWISYQ